MLKTMQSTQHIVKLLKTSSFALSLAVLGSASFGLVASISSSQAHAEELVIDIVKKAVKTPTVAIVPFKNNQSVSSIISQDLSLSGKLALDTGLPEQPHFAKDINIETWRSLGVPYVVVGRVINRGGAVEFNLIDINNVKSMLNGAQRYNVPKGGMSKTAHVIADVIYEALIGKKSDFSGKLAYVLETKKGGKPSYNIRVSDTDGKNAKTILSSPEPIRSLTWSPNGRSLAYVSYETGRPHIYIQNVYTQARRAVAKFKGTNDSPSFSPDGSKLLFTSSKTGNYEIYMMNLSSGSIRQLTNHRAYDTDPNFAPDGKSFVFTSDRSGRPQIYQYSFLTGQTRRLTLVGSYNTRPRFNKSGTKLALIHNYRAAVMDLNSGAITTVGSSADDESPSFAPNSDVVVYATKAGRNQRIQMVSTSGQQRKNLPAVKGKMRDPAWAPKN